MKIRSATYSCLPKTLSHADTSGGPHRGGSLEGDDLGDSGLRPACVLRDMEVPQNRNQLVDVEVNITATTRR